MKAYGDWAGTAAGLGLLAFETQMVMAMRIAGMMGAWSVLPTENRRMVDEKAPAFAEAAYAAGMAAMSGRRPDEVLDVWTRSLRKKTRANARRLGRRGPKFN
ncbi:MAG: antifreeze protein [Hasllibacter sp.]